MTRYARIATPLGTMIAIAEEGKLVGLDFEDAKYAPAIDCAWIEEPAFPALRECARQVAEYFAARRTRFDLPLAPRGTPFQQRVWREIAKVPVGETITYAELARLAGSPGSARAVGAATGRNPLAIVVPCHRIVGANGSLTGYAGGLPRKRRLLALEAAPVAAAA
ncbi:MAG: methylated-DNA--[protein]-cysteine S-methyltransferase [Betaproteobacteria bacterium]|nr:methylated-DNA--[protein]-cysteine S-methyltransferase [Betaproteobacteria bacterium]